MAIEESEEDVEGLRKLEWGFEDSDGLDSIEEDLKGLNLSWQGYLHH